MQARSVVIAALGALMGMTSVTLADTKRTTFKVTGRVQSTPRICGGGAAMREDQMGELPEPTPLSGLGLLALSGTSITNQRPTARATTNSAGRFTMNLSRGTWCIFRADRKLPPGPSQGRAPVAKPTGANGIDQDCLDAEARRCDAVVTVQKATNVDLDFPNGCSEPWNRPCYHGPMPP